MTKTLSDLSLKTLRKMLRDTERTFGADCKSAATLRRTIARQEYLASLPPVLRELFASMDEAEFQLPSALGEQ